MKFMVNGQVIDEDNIAVVVPGFCTRFVFNVSNFIPDTETNYPDYWAWKSDANAAYAVKLKDGSQLLVARWRHDGEYEALDIYYKRIKQDTYQALYPELNEPRETNEQRIAREKEEAAARLRKELDF